MRLSLRIYVVSKVNHDMAIRLEHESFCLLRRHLQIQGVFNQHRRFSCQRSAGVVCLDRLLFLCPEKLRCVYIYSSFFDLLASYQSYCKARCLIQRIGMVEVLLMVFWLLT